MKKNKAKYFDKALASLFFVGLGQIIKGEGDKGLKFLLAFYFGIPAFIYTSLMINAWFFLAVLGVGSIAEVVIWIYNIYDALTHEAFI